MRTMISSQNNSRQNGFTTAFLLLAVAMSLWIGFKIMRLATANPANQLDARIAVNPVFAGGEGGGGRGDDNKAGGDKTNDKNDDCTDCAPYTKEGSAEKSSEKSVDKGADKDGEGSGEKSDEKGVDKSGEESVDKSVEESVDKSVDKSVDDRDDRGGEITPPAPPIITSFVGSPNPIIRGQTSQLTWTSTNANFCNGVCVSGDCNEWTGTNKPANGSQNVSPRTTATYELTCIGIGGSDTERTTIGVRTVKWREVIPRLLPFLNRVLLGMSE